MEKLISRYRTTGFFFTTGRKVNFPSDLRCDSERSIFRSRNAMNRLMSPPSRAIESILMDSRDDSCRHVYSTHYVMSV